MSFLDRIAECNNADLTGYRPFRVGGTEVGLVDRDFARHLQAFPEVFDVADTHVELNDELRRPEDRTRAVDGVLRLLAAEDVIRHWRDEPYPVAAGYGRPTLFTMERAAVAKFGVTAYGVHLNGYVRKADGLHVWVGRRATDRPVSPGKLDQLVAGGQPADLSLTDNLAKECAEEAAIPADLAARAVPVGAVSYLMQREEGLRRDVLFNYDLELPEDFVPENTDGEIAEFFLWPAEKVAETTRGTTDFKFNCNLVNIDFLIRHGIIPPEDPDYLDLLRGLHG